MPIKRAVWCEASEVRVRVHVHREQDLAVYGARAVPGGARPLQRVQLSALAVVPLRLRMSIMARSPSGNSSAAESVLAVLCGFRHF